MADTITSSNVLDVGFDYTLDGENKTIKFEVPDCKHNLTEADIKTNSALSLFINGYILAEGTVSLKSANVYTADETAVQKIMIDIEGD